MSHLSHVRKLLLAVSFLVLFLLCTGVTRADTVFIGFSGLYAVGNWTTTLNNSDGGVNTVMAPIFVTLTGGDNGSGQFGETLFSITVPTTTIIAFGLYYSTVDEAPSRDPAGYEIDGTKYQFSPGDYFVPPPILAAGQQFGFYVDTIDNLGGPATLEVYGAPEPSSFALLAAGLLGLAGLFRRGSRQLG